MNLNPSCRYLFKVRSSSVLETKTQITSIPNLLCCKQASCYASSPVLPSSTWSSSTTARTGLSFCESACLFAATDCAHTDIRLSTNSVPSEQQLSVTCWRAKMSACILWMFTSSSTLMKATLSCKDTCLSEYITSLGSASIGVTLSSWIITFWENMKFAGS